MRNRTPDEHERPRPAGGPPSRSRRDRPAVRVVHASRQEMANLFYLDEDLEAVRRSMSNGLRRLRLQRGMTQAELAQRIGSSQPRVARIESGEGATLDLLMRCLRAVNASWDEIAAMITSGPERRKG